MPPRKSQTKKPRKDVAALAHLDDARTNIPTAEFEAMVDPAARAALLTAYERRNPDLDPQLVWRGKDVADWSQLVVPAPPIYIQEKILPLALIRDLESHRSPPADDGEQIDLFADFDGPVDDADRTAFYEHERGWTNRMILGDSLQVMASLAEREGLRGQVQCVYIDPPYGIRFNSNFQWSTTTRSVTDGKADHITREPEQVKAFRDTWRDGVHSYLTYLRDRLTVARDLLHESGSVFVQIGDENVHRVRALLDEVFGAENFVSEIVVKTTTGASSPTGGTASLAGVHDCILWYARRRDALKYRQLFFDRADMQSADVYRRVLMPNGEQRPATAEELSGHVALPEGASLFAPSDLTSQSSPESAQFTVRVGGHDIHPGKRRGWSTNREGMSRLRAAGRLFVTRNRSLRFIRRWDDFPAAPINNVWTDVSTGSFTADKVYVVQTNTKIVQRCLLMASDPGDLVLDPTSGSGTTAVVAEQWGRRWIAIDTSRVAVALARARLMGSRFPFYVLVDSPEGQVLIAEQLGRAPSTNATGGSVRFGFVCRSVPRITSRSIARNAEIDVIEAEHKASVQVAIDRLNGVLGADFEPWDVPVAADPSWSTDVVDAWSSARSELSAMNAAIQASVVRLADREQLLDQPYEDRAIVRVAGPFTVESLSPHRSLDVDEHGDVALSEESDGASASGQSFAEIVLENLRSSGVQQAHKEDKIHFDSLTPWPGDLVCAEGRYEDGDGQRRAGIFIGPEFGTVQRADLVAAAREASEGGFDVLVACAFNYEAHTTEFAKLGSLPVLKARINADLHMADDLKNTGAGNLFVIFGEPDIELIDLPDGQVQVRILGVDVFDPSSGEVRSDNADGIAAWFIDTDYDEESFFVRHAYFLGADDPYKSLKTSLKAEIDAEAWESLNSDVSRPFDRPASGRIAVKVINHLGDEVMKVFRLTS